MAAETSSDSDSVPFDAATDVSFDEAAGRGSAKDEAGQAESLDRRIRDRAYLISQGDDTGSPEENWQRAERELAEEEGAALADRIAQRAKEAAFRAAMTHP